MRMADAPDPPDAGLRLRAAADFTRIEAIFAETADLDAEGRARVLDVECGHRPDVRREVEALLMAHDRVSSASTSDDGDAPDIGAGSRLGAYRLVERIGEGGMGEVYRAERADGVFAQQVAIKLTRSSIGRLDVLRRFKIERQILASLNHPNIVTLLDGGASADGRAYLVMEYVPGATLVRHCRERMASLEERLRMFQVVCGAVQYAHQHAIVHRDLKPANIVITADGVPKVLDFGVAKLLEGPMEAGATTIGLLPGPLTPNYASPEQLRGLAVTTASDVYALGVLLYELISGVRPYETHGETLDRVLEIVIHREPARPSTRQEDLSRSGLPYPRARLRGDLDAIVLKAMSKEPAGRYDSPAAVAGDLGRFLKGEPVLARAPSTGYVLRRLAARHKTLVGVSALALLAILATSGIAVWQRQMARRAQARAEERFREVRQLANALIFKIHDAVMPLAGSTPVRRTIVNEALAYLERLEAESHGDVGLRMELAAAYRQIGGILGDGQRPNLGDRDGAIREYERARALVVPLATEAAPFEAISSLAEADRSLADLYSRQNDQDRAIATAREGVDYATRYLQRHPTDDRALPLLAASTFTLAWTLRSRESTPVWLRALEHYERLLAAKPHDLNAQRNVALVSKYLGANFERARDFDQARRHYARSLELDEVRLAAAPGNRQTEGDAAISFSNMASVTEIRGEWELAARLFERSLALRRTIAETDPTDVLARERLGYLLGRMTRFYQRRGDLPTARRLGPEAVGLIQGVLDATHDVNTGLTLAFAWLQIAQTEARANHHAAACQAYRRADALQSQAGNRAESHANEIAETARGLATCGAPGK